MAPVPSTGSSGRDESSPKITPPLKVVGSIKERGFGAAYSPSSDKISVPRPRVTPFPVARHRSEGPRVFSSAATQRSGGDEMSELPTPAISAEPLGRRKGAQSSHWRSSRKSERCIKEQTQNAFDDTRREEDISTSGGIVPPAKNGEGKLVQGQRMSTLPEESCREVPLSDAAAVVERTLPESLANQTPHSVGLEAKPVLLEEREGHRGEELGLMKQVTQSGRRVFTDPDIDAENRNKLSGMTSEEIAEAQAELSQRVKPELLELFRRRGAEKERKRLAEKAGGLDVSQGDAEASVNLGYKKKSIETINCSTADLPPTKVPVAPEDGRSLVNTKREIEDFTASTSMDTVRGTKVGPADLLNAVGNPPLEGSSVMKADEEPPPPPSTDPWTLRVEAVRMIRFDLNGNVVSSEHLTGSNSEPDRVEGSDDNGQQNILSVVERDYLRMEGDPAGLGYSLKEALVLVRSTVAGQRAVALRLIASVLDKAVLGLLYPTRHDHEGIDWQAIWAYALGPEAELVLTLRLALDDGHSTVVAGCAKAIQALLSYSVNEDYFKSLEEHWPADKAIYTAPIFRKKSTKNEGFIGGGSWKYNVKKREMFPFLDSLASEEGEDSGKDTVGDDGHVSNKDVAAGLIRMGVLPRIRFLLEVDELIAAEEALLSILICMARHSPTGANAVMRCPRLIDAILHRFIGTAGSLPDESLSARLKAIRLLKVLSLARRSNCVHFQETGVLDTVMRPLYVSQPRGPAQDDLRDGFVEIMIETIRFWRVCVDYHIGISLFSECYSTLCFWLLPVSKEEILIPGRGEPLLLLAVESYSLVEHIARTLPFLHGKLSGIEELEQKGVVTWSWGVAIAMLETALNWLSPEYIAGVHELLQQYLQTSDSQSLEAIVLRRRTSNVIRVLSAVLHFLGTVCERIVSEKERQNALDDQNNCTLPWLPKFVPKLGLVIARTFFEKYEFKVSAVRAEQMHSLLECLFLFKTAANDDSALVGINCLNAIIRVSSMVDILIQIGKRTSTSSHVYETDAHKILDHGLLQSSKRELGSLLLLCKDDVTSRRHLLQMSVRGGPAPGLGVGWGAFCGGAWSKEVTVAQTSAKLAVDLISMMSLNSRSGPLPAEGKMVKQGQASDGYSCDIDPNWRLKLGLAVVATSTTLRRDLLLQVSSDLIFHPSVLSILIQKMEEMLKSFSPKRGLADVAKDLVSDPMNLSKLLLNHHEDFWLSAKEKKREKKAGYGGKKLLATIDEEDAKDNISHPASLMEEWVGQRLPLPSHWFLSPLVIDLVQASKKDWESGLDSASEQTLLLEKVIRAGLAFFLGFEVLEASNTSESGERCSSQVSLVKKIHSLSTVFVSGGDVFLHPVANKLIRALQSLFGDEVGNLLQHATTKSSVLTIEDKQKDSIDQRVDATSDQCRDSEFESVATAKSVVLDFEGSVDASYVNYAEIIAEQFVATSFGDLAFGRQVALHLCLNVPLMIRLATWRVLTDGQVLDLLPPLTQCCGPPHLYLHPIEQDQQVLKSFVSAWSSGALDKAASGDTLSFTLVLHHVAGFLFTKSDSDDILLLKTKTIRTLVRSAIRKSARQKMLSRLVNYVPAFCPCSNCQLASASETEPTDDVKSRIFLLSMACEGDRSLIAEVERLQKGHV